MLSYYNVHVTKNRGTNRGTVLTLPRAPLGRIVNDLCFSPEHVF